MRVPTIAALLLGAALTPAAAQTQPAPPSRAGCNAAPVTAPTTPTSQDTAGGTAPGTTGTTGFSGAGIGGSFTGTSPNGAVAGSRNVQPATAKGLDPMTAPPKPSDTGKC